MTDSIKHVSNTRSSPRSNIPLEVEVEISGDRQKVLLISKDIGAGGVFLRTKDPCELWKKVRLSLKSPAGDSIEVTGEVVRRVTVEQAREKGHPPGIAVAFDEVSRAKRKELISLVLELLDTMDEIVDSKEPPQKQPAMYDKKKSSPTAGSDDHTNSTKHDYQSLKKSLDEYKKKLAGNTYYHILGLGPDATQDQIKTAYRQLMIRFKPPAPLEHLPKELLRDLSKILGKIRKAFSILSKPDRKRAYDFLIDNDLK